MSTAPTLSSFELSDDWKGHAREHRWRHACGGVAMALFSELQHPAAGCTGCKFCDRTGNPGRWLDFLDRLKVAGYVIDGPDRFTVRKQAEIVPIRCESHPLVRIDTWTRNKLMQWLAPNGAGARKVRPPCEQCSVGLDADNAEKKAQKSELSRASVDDRLAKFHHETVSWSGASERLESGEIQSKKNRIRCLQCGAERDAFVLQLLQKAEARGDLGCPSCRVLEKGPKAKQIC